MKMKPSCKKIEAFESGMFDVLGQLLNSCWEQFPMEIVLQVLIHQGPEYSRTPTLNAWILPHAVM